MERLFRQSAEESFNAIAGVSAFLLSEHQCFDELIVVGDGQGAIPDKVLRFLKQVDRGEAWPAGAVVEQVHFAFQIPQIVWDTKDLHVSGPIGPTVSLRFFDLLGDQPIKATEDSIGSDVPTNLVPKVAVGQVSARSPLLPPRNDNSSNDRKYTADRLNPCSLHFGLHHAPANPSAIHAIPLCQWGKA
ncbi:TPA: hypothetical protein ACKQAW_003492 [Stenotrophomonas maltophilia]